MTIEKIILSNLIGNESYARKVIPHLKKEFFQERHEQVVFELIQDYVAKYQGFPTKEALYIDLSHKTNLNEAIFNSSKDLIRELEVERGTGEKWLIDTTEQFCKDAALYNAVMTSIQFVDKNQTKHDISLGELPDLLKNALSVSFDTSIGHRFIDDAEKRFEFYHKKENKIPFDLEYFNKITKGGVSKKSLNVLMAVTGVGKSLVMCHMAAANLRLGKNVLYLTLEMSEERIGERIDANLLNVDMDSLHVMEKDKYLTGIHKLRAKSQGEIVIKEYGPGTASVNHFRHLLRELKLKQRFVPDIIYLDYLNLCASANVKLGNSVNTYTLVKHIAEEVRALAVENDIPIISATQTNRNGVDNSNPSLADTSESFGLPQTVDLFLCLIDNENLRNLNQIVVSQLKNRYADPNSPSKFVIGIDRSRMKLYDVEQHAQVEDKPVMDDRFGGENDHKESKSLLDFSKKSNKKNRRDVKSLFEGIK